MLGLSLPLLVGGQRGGRLLGHGASVPAERPDSVNVPSAQRRDSRVMAIPVPRRSDFAREYKRSIPSAADRRLGLIAGKSLSTFAAAPRYWCSFRPSLSSSLWHTGWLERHRAGAGSLCSLQSLWVSASRSQLLARTSHVHLFWLSSPQLPLRRHSLASM
jgi:hypothetical protein